MPENNGSNTEEEENDPGQKIDPPPIIISLSGPIPIPNVQSTAYLAVIIASAVFVIDTLLGWIG